MEQDLKSLVGTSEKILWEGRPNKKCFIYESIFNPMLPFALFWALIDGGIFGGFVFAGTLDEIGFFLIPFMLLHMMPVWIYLIGVIFSIKKYKNTYYIVTDKAIYISGGLLTKSFDTKPFAEMSHIDLKRSFFDQMFHVGDILASSSQNHENGSASISINSISDYEKVYQLVKKLQEDIYTDIMYPNDLRPKENHGYKTEYKG